MALKQLTFDFRYDVPAFCTGTRGMVTLEREGRGPHAYTAEGVPENELPLYEFARTCPECQRILEEHYADLDRMDKTINGPSRVPAARPKAAAPAVPDVEERMHDIVFTLKREEPEYAAVASGEQ